MVGLAAFIVGAGALASLVGLWLVLRFLRHVYDKGGVSDLKIAASAVRMARWPQISRARPNEPGDAGADAPSITTSRFV